MRVPEIHPFLFRNVYPVPVCVVTLVPLSCRGTDWHCLGNMERLWLETFGGARNMLWNMRVAAKKKCVDAVVLCCKVFSPFADSKSINDTWNKYTVVDCGYARFSFLSRSVFFLPTAYSTQMSYGFTEALIAWEGRKFQSSSSSAFAKLIITRTMTDASGYND